MDRGTERWWDLQPRRCSKPLCMRSRATHWPCFEPGVGLRYGTGTSHSPCGASAVPCSHQSPLLQLVAASPPTPCVHSPGDSQGKEDISRLAGATAVAQSHQKLPPGPAVLSGADGEIWSSLGSCWPGQGVATKAQSCIESESEGERVQEDPHPLENTLCPGKTGQAWPRNRNGSSAETFPLPIQLS